jgi:hypothetical protein
MQTRIRSFVLFASLPLSFGCGTRDARNPAPAQPDDRLEKRFLEVIRINEEGKKQEALAQIATDAAEAGDTANTWKALGWMKDAAGRDTAARSCALKLAALGKREDAILITEHQITNPDLRRTTRAEIANSKAEK